MKKQFINYFAAALVVAAIFLSFCKKKNNNGSSTTGGTSTTTGSTSTGGTTTGGTTTGSATGYSTGGYGHASHAAIHVHLYDKIFDPSNISFPGERSVIWTNRDTRSHTVTSAEGLFDSGEIGNGETYVTVLTQPGTYLYFCRYHKESGKIVIQ